MKIIGSSGELCFFEEIVPVILKMGMVWKYFRYESDISGLQIGSKSCRNHKLNRMLAISCLCENWLSCTKTAICVSLKAVFTKKICRRLK